MHVSTVLEPRETTFGALDRIQLACVKFSNEEFVLRNVFALEVAGLHGGAVKDRVRDGGVVVPFGVRTRLEVAIEHPRHPAQGAIQHLRQLAVPGCCRDELVKFEDGKDKASTEAEPANEEKPDTAKVGLDCLFMNDYYYFRDR